jgi:lipoate-protein ligase A
MAGTTWRLVDLDGIEPVATQAVYEAAAIARSNGTVPDTLIICWPKSPLVCVGYFQEPDKEVNVEYCQAKGIPVVRRILGGGTVYLDSGQIFYQVIGKRGDRVIPTHIGDIFRKLLKGPIKTCRELGVPATYRPVNDIEVEGRKISGNGAAEFDGVAILTGNIIIDFDYDEMTKILKVPDEKFRDKLAKSLKERVTTVRRELGRIPEHQEVKEPLVRNFEETLGVKFDRKPLSQQERKLLDKLTKEKYLSKKWTYANSNRHEALSQPRIVKVSSQSRVSQAIYKSMGGLISITAELVEGKINDILITGDFTFLPPKIPELERALVHAEVAQQPILNVIERFYNENGIESPGTTPDDFMRAILIASGV